MTAAAYSNARLERAIVRIAARDAAVRAWAHLAPPDHLRQQAAVLANHPGPLAGWTLGVKDVIDVEGMPTGCGSPIEAGRPAHADAASVARLRAAGALVVGKTVTAEYAFSQAGPTRNPHDLARTPGGSSSGSAAAVADGQCDVALASQTGGSTIRPAAFCGIVGYKPPFGTVPLDGLRILAPTLDTIGVHARNVEAAARVASVLEGRERATRGGERPLLVALGLRGFLPEDDADRLERLSSEVLGRLAAAGCRLVRRDVPEAFAAIDEAHRTLMSAAVARSLGALVETDGGRLSPALTRFIERGRTETEIALARAAGVVARAHEDLSRLVDDGALLVWPAATGEAPAGLAYTGDSVLNRPWSLLGYGVVTVPCGRGPTGLPLGLQIIDPAPGAPRLFSTAALVEQALGEPGFERLVKEDLT